MPRCGTAQAGTGHRRRPARMSQRGSRQGEPAWRVERATYTRYGGERYNVQRRTLAGFGEAYEQFIQAATEADRRGMTRQGDIWGPREIVAHLAGWEVMASVRIPRLAAGKHTASPPSFETVNADEQALMNDAINATIVTMAGHQSLAALCNLLRQVYQENIKMLKKLDDSFFQPGDYVYERTKDVSEHCREHREQLAHG